MASRPAPEIPRSSRLRFESRNQNRTVIKMQTFDISLSPESGSELLWGPIFVRILSSVEIFQPGDHLVVKTASENIFRHGIVLSCDRANIDVLHFDEKGVHCTLLGQFCTSESDRCYRINYAHYDQTEREKVVARAEAFAEPPGLGSHSLATDPEDYLAYCLAGTWHVPRKEVPVGPPVELPPIPPGRPKDMGSCCFA